MLFILTILYCQFFQLNYAYQNGNNTLESEHQYSRISDKKCKDYQAAIYDKIWVERDVITGEVITLYNTRCPHSFTDYIVGGYIANSQEFPHMALIGSSNTEPTTWFCCGALISDEYILTAAHCLQYNNVSEYAIRLGELDYKEVLLDDATPENFTVIEQIKHPKYKSEQIYNDIALFKLSRKVIFTHYIRPACLSTNLKDYESQYAIATGWGGTYPGDGGGRPSSILKKVILKKFEYDECNDYYMRIQTGGIFERAPDFVQNISQICYGSKKGTGIGDTCRGDSGGPLQIYHNDTINYSCMYSLIGVTSTSQTCGHNFPGIYVRVHHYLDWIENIVWPNEKL